MYSISKRYSFSAGHFLYGLPEGHPCARQHGHNYEVEVLVTADRLDRVGFIVDYNELDEFMWPVVARFDHRNLNDTIEQPTAENLAELIWRALNESGLTARLEGLGGSFLVGVSETQKTWARFQP